MDMPTILTNHKLIKSICKDNKHYQNQIDGMSSYIYKTLDDFNLKVHLLRDVNALPRLSNHFDCKNFPCQVNND